MADLDLGTLGGSIEIVDHGSAVADVVSAAVGKTGDVMDTVAAKATNFGNTFEDAFKKVESRSFESQKSAQEMHRAFLEAFENPIGAMKQFGQSLESDVLGSLGKVGLVAAAVVGSISGISFAITELGTKGSTIIGVEDAFGRLTAAIGQSADVMLGALRTATKGTVSDLQLMQDANKALSAGVKLTAGDMATLGAAARITGQSMGTDTASAVDMLSNALIRGNTRVLQRVGINIDAKKAENDFAASIGTTASQLNSLGVIEAKRQASLAAMRDLVAKAGDSELTLKERLEQGEVAISGWVEKLEVAVAKSPAVGAAFDAIGSALKRAFPDSGQSAIDFIIAGIDKFSGFVQTAIPYVEQAFGAVKNFWNWLVQLNDEFNITGTIIAVVEAAWSALKTAFNFVRDAVIGVMAAWQNMPQWLRDLTIKSAEVSLAMYALGTAVSSTNTPLANQIPLLANLAQIASVVISPIKSIITELGFLATLIGEFGWAGFVLGVSAWGESLVAVTVGPLAGMISGMYASATAAGLATTSFAAAGMAIAAWAVPILATVAALTWLYNEVQLVREDNARAADATVQLGIDSSNLARINKATGQSFTDIGTATAFVAKQMESLRNGFIPLADALKELQSNSGNTSSQIRNLEAAVIGYSNAAKLSYPQEKQIADAIKATGVAAKDLPPALLAIADAFGIFNKSADPQYLKGVVSELDKLNVDINFEKAKAGIEATEDGFAKEADLMQANHDKAMTLINIEAHAKEAAGQMQESDRALFAAKRQDESLKYAASQITLQQKVAQTTDQIQQASLDAAAAADASANGKSLASKLAAIDDLEAKELNALGIQYGWGEQFYDQYNRARLAKEADFQTKRQVLTQQSAQVELQQEQKLQDAVTAAESITDLIGLDKTKQDISNKLQAEQDALKIGILGFNDYWYQRSLIDQKGYALLTNADVAWQRQMDKSIQAVVTQDQEVLLGIYESGEKLELDQNEQKRLAKLEQLHQEGKDQGAAGAELVAQQNKLSADLALSIVAKNDPVMAAWKTLNVGLSTTWASTWDQMLSGTISFSNAFATTLQAAVSDPFRKMLAGMLADWEQRLLSPMIGSMKDVLGSLLHIPTSGATGGAGAAGLAGMFGKSAAAAGPAGFVAGSTGTFDSGTGEFVPDFGSGGSTAEPSSGGASASSIAGGGIMALSGAISLIQAKTMPQALMAGTELGAGIGTMIAPGIGTVIGAGIGFLVGALKHLFGADHTLDNIARDAGKDFGTTFSKNTTDAIVANMQSGMSEAASELNNLSSIIADAGGLTDKNIGTFLPKFHDLFSMIDTGQLTAAQANDQLQASFPALAAAATNAYGVWSDDLKAIIVLDQQHQLHTQAITDALVAQSQALDTGFAAVIQSQQPVFDGYAAIGTAVTDAQAKVDSLTKSGQQGTAAWASATSDLTKALAVQAGAAQNAAGSINILSTDALLAFNSAIASGKTFAAALNSISPQLDKLDKAYKDLGLQASNPIIKGLLLQNSIATSNPDLSAGIGGLSQMLTAAQNIPGLLTPDSFSGLEQTAGGLYTQNQGATAAQGGDTQNALLPFEDFLHQAQAYADQTKTQLDPQIAQMIAQSKELGIWSDTVATAADKQLLSTQDLIKSNYDLISALEGHPVAGGTGGGGTSGTGGGTGGAGGGDSAPGPGGVPTPPIGGGGDGGTGGIQQLSTKIGGEEGIRYASTGGLITASGLIMPEYHAFGGYAGNVVPFVPKGPDTIPVMASPGEEILSVASTQAYNNAMDMINGAADQPEDAPQANDGKSTTVNLLVDGRIMTSVVLEHATTAATQRTGQTRRLAQSLAAMMPKAKAS